MLYLQCLNVFAWRAGIICTRAKQSLIFRLHREMPIKHPRQYTVYFAAEKISVVALERSGVIEVKLCQLCTTDEVQTG